MTRADTSKPSNPKSRRSVLLGIVLLALVVIPQAYWFLNDYKNVAPLPSALWSFYLAFILAISRHQQGKSFLFDGILWFFKNLHIPRNELFVYAYSGAFAILGSLEVRRLLGA